MALGKVSVNNLNLGQGAVTEIERYFLFIGPGAKSVGNLLRQYLFSVFPVDHDLEAARVDIDD